MQHIFRLLVCVLVISCAAIATAQQPGGLIQPVPQPEPRTPTPPPVVEKVDATTFRIGKIRVDTARREVTVPGVVNPITTVEFVASTRDGVKSYETAIGLDTDAIAFNTALLLIGLDPARARAATVQFDRVAPAGDPVEISVSWTQGRTTKRSAIEELLFNERTKKTLAPGPWVYTGSTFVGAGSERRFLADIEGVLIGLMRAPQALIDSPREDAFGSFGAIVLNAKLIPSGTPVTLTVKALEANAARPKR